MNKNLWVLFELTMIFSVYIAALKIDLYGGQTYSEGTSSTNVNGRQWINGCMFQSLHNGNTIISSPEIFLPGLDELQKHFINDVILHYLLCIAIKQTHEHPEKVRIFIFETAWREYTHCKSCY